MRKTKPLALSAAITLFTFTSIANAGSKQDSQSIDSELQQAVVQYETDGLKLLPKKGGSVSSRGGSEGTTGAYSDGSMPDEIALNPEISSVKAASCTSHWWVSGNHSWKWKSYWAYLKIELKGKSWTRYGNSDGPCDIPLTVDKIEVIGDTKAYNGTATGKARINKVAYNTNVVEDSDKDKAYGYNLTQGPCGAVVLHRATKNGITWSHITKSGCGGVPGTH